MIQFRRYYVPVTFILLGLAALIAMRLPPQVLITIFPPQGVEPFGSSILLALFVVLAAALVLSLLLLVYGLANAGREQDPLAGRRITAVIAILLSFVLLAASLHSAYRFTLWDNTHDALGLICLSGPFLAIFFATILALLALPGKTKLVAVLFALLTPAALAGISFYGGRIDIREQAETRADRVTLALEDYRQTNGRYPHDLSDLTPRYLLTLPEPGVIFAQEWCYESDGAGYALGYVTRDHWSDPRLYARVRFGGTGHDQNVCETAVAALAARAPDYFTRMR